MVFSNPSNADITITIAAVTTATVKVEIADIILIILCDFLEKRYRRAMKNGRFKFLLSV